MAGDRWNWFRYEKKWEVYKAYNAALFHAFRRHGLDIRLLSTDEAVTRKPEEIWAGLEWARDNMNASGTGPGTYRSPAPLQTIFTLRNVTFCGRHFPAPVEK